MTLAETIMIMAKLSAFYGQGKSDAKIMARAWHEILEPYDYKIASGAVTQYARNDMRDYATFPTAGVIVEAIEQEYGVRRRIYNGMLAGVPYKEIGERAREIISEEDYNNGVKLGGDYLRGNKQAVIASIDGGRIEQIQEPKD